MTEEKNTVSGTTPSTPAGSLSGPGRLIREAREAAKYSQEDLASLLKLNRNTLDALERDDFSVLNEPVYIRGYYRKLAKVLGIVESQLLQAFEAVSTPKTNTPPPSRLILSGDDEGRGGSNLGLFVGVIVAGAVLGGIALWYSRNHSTPSVPTVPVAESLAPITVIHTVTAPLPVTAVKPVRPAASVSVPSTAAATVTATIAPTTTTAAAVISPVAASTAPASSVASVAPASGNVVEFSATCWAQAKDATGKTLFSKVFQPGEKIALEGKPPFAVRAGNAEGIKVSFNGKAFDGKAFMKPDKTASFSVQ
jgi:cytoskeleton protein RodZ